MALSLPTHFDDFKTWTLKEIEPLYAQLEAASLDETNVTEWMRDLAQVNSIVSEIGSRLHVQTTLNTEDQAGQERFLNFIEQVVAPLSVIDQRLKQKLLASGLQLAEAAIALRDFRAEVDLFREENVPLFTQEEHLSVEYDTVIGAQSVMWDDGERTLAQMRPLYLHTDRTVRERAWRITTDRQLADRETLNGLWQRFLSLRQQIAKNAGLPDYRAFMWRDKKRFDYTPDDCLRFHDAIEAVVVPAAERLYEKKRQRLGVDTLRPWDTEVDPAGKEPLTPFGNAGELIATSGRIFQAIDSELGGQFAQMHKGGLLDLDNRKSKAPGGYCTYFAVAKTPFIFMNAVGIHDDVQTLLHEAGHAFHAFATSQLPDHQLLNGPPMEFNEVASMAMELLGAPYLNADLGGFYNAGDADRAFVEHLEGMIRFWPYMAVVDSFQHWVYTHPTDAADPSACDQAWASLWDRFMRGIDYSGLDDVKATGWHRKLHIFQVPFYYIEYGIAQLGAAQVWRAALKDHGSALAHYKQALALGGSASLPNLYNAAGIKLAMDAETLRDAVDLIETTIDRLDPA